MTKWLFGFIILFSIGFIFNPEKIFAVSTTISNIPLINTDSFTITVTISGASLATNYLQIDLYKENTTNYFGETYNGASWYRGTDFSQYFPAIIQSGSPWQSTISGRLGNPSLTEYDGLGQYKLRVRRYTASGNYSSSEANAGAIDVNIIVPTATPIPTSTLTPTQTPTPTISSTQTITQTPSPTEIISSTPTPISSSTPTSSPNPTPTPTIYDNIYLSEVMIYPETGEHEWVELYNDNDYTVSLQNWYVDDLENAGSAPKLFSLEIPAKDFGSFDLTTSVFNNDDDQVRLLDLSKLLRDDFEYTKAVKGKTYGRISLETDEFCLQEPSKNSVNNPCIYPTNISSPTLTNSPVPTKILMSTTTSISTSSALPVNGKIIYETGPKIEPVNDVNIDSLLTERGDVLSAKTENKIVYNKMVTYVKGLTSSSFFISILNIFYIVHKMLRRLHEKN